MSDCRLIYDRYFDAKPSCQLNGETVIGADVELLFTFKDANGEEILYSEGDECIAQESLIVCVDRLHGVKSSEERRNCANIASISAEPVKFYLDVYVGKAGDCIKDCPEELKEAHTSRLVELTKEDFVTFIRKNWRCFNNSQNMRAYCTAMRYLPVGEPA